MHYENLVFGATLDSLFFAMKNGYPLIYSTPKKPFEFDESLQDWKHAYFFLSLSGLIPFADKARRTRLIGDNELEVLTEKKRYEVSYSTLFVFDDTGLVGLPEPISRTSDKNIVYDWIKIKKGSDIKDTIMNFEEGFVEQIIFYQKENCKNPNLKDLVVKSTLTTDDLKNEEFSELFVKFHVEELLETNLDRKIDLLSRYREVRSLGRNIYNPIDGIIFVDNAGEIDYSSSNGYLTKLLGYLRG